LKRRIYIFVNGIMCRPGDAQNWNARAVNWIHLNTEDRAVMVEYFFTPFSRILRAKSVAEKVAEVLEAYHGWEIFLVGHSNGCAEILEALALMDWPRIEALHLVSAACEADFDRNGLKFAFARRAIGAVRVWMSGRDSALHLVKCKLGRLLGYGALGVDGPRGADELLADRRVAVTVWSTRDHSDCFKPYAFSETMRGFLSEGCGVRSAELEPEKTGIL
jgi:pimeloyl-ACP methyl ester carboxylesterase